MFEERARKIIQIIYLYLYTEVHGITSQKTVILILVFKFHFDVRTVHLVQFILMYVSSILYSLF